MIYDSIKKLVSYGLEKGLIDPVDRVYCTNRILEALGLEEYDEPQENFSDVDIEQTLAELLDYAVEKGLCEDSVVYRDLFDTKLMGLITPPPSAVNRRFAEDMKISPETATDNYYKFSCDTDYIRRYRIAKDVRYKSQTEYGELDITINLSKPEKDPKAIAAAKNAKQAGYPKCMLCRECEGYAGRVNYPARQNHRIIGIKICGEDWGFQYSPYVYYNEHCIVFNKKHTPMVIDRSAFDKLLSFVTVFPHYFVGSNADLPIVGGSILSHEHFQGGRYTFAMERAEVETPVVFKGYENISAGIVKWPMSVIRLTGSEPDKLAELADKILTEWRGYTDESEFIFAETDGEAHNTITPIARRRGDLFELDLVLRNNITTDEHPLGVYHPHAELHHIKKENIGLIEVMGLAVLPSRLKDEMAKLEQAIVNGSDIRSDEVLEKHADWVEDILSRRTVTAENAAEVLREEIGIVFAKVLEHAGVYKRTNEGRQAFMRFIDHVNGR
ncbi:UDPglucose--hexose-1-phosphate uridylyltransferase [Ruminococcus sp. YE71]|uniref:UDP-glucose--hexose-1-phosphate uridylyltransferase n=1 Tax=unclassified Ruminococcus TaxID=2608920 RepID=UPI000890EFCF|nr:MULTISPECIES: UDP-glucose--hexose-1-phosphate uridylyltransferase [unclassified Ruminococcus]SDA24187.1 UDPglucose--hexose-1-phosphate uridylyltransferase [Ruminococcus sp. YE78]SFW41539.1 UDPglucose--hexose-1-phosphate uridylyltransferase [Ruminococcus sp. YE71]